MSLNGDSCSTSSGCVSDLDILSEDPSPDSPISDSISDSLISTTNSVTKSLPNNEEYDKELITGETTLLSLHSKVPEVAQEVDELLEELIETEIIIDSSPVDCVDTLSLNADLSINQILTANCYELLYESRKVDNDQTLISNESTDCFRSFKTSVFEFNRSLCSKLETASIKSDTSQTSGHESDGTRQSTDSGGHNTRADLRRPILNELFKEVKDFQCFSSTHEKRVNSSKTSTNSSNSSTNSDTNSNDYYCCKWTNCDWPGSKDDLVDHIREIHVELQPYQQQRHNWNESQTKTKTTAKPTKPSLDDTSSSSVSTPSVSTKKLESAQQYVCLWEGCKVYGKGSSSRNWLERHVLEQHSGPRPFKCIVEGCGQRFKLQSTLERHVNSHFKPSVDYSTSNCSTESNSLCNSCCANNDSSVCPNTVHGLSPFELHLRQTARATMSAVRCKTSSLDSSSNSHHLCTNGTPIKILKRKKSNQKIRRKCFYVKCSEDYFDECVMEQVRYGLIQLSAQTGLDISGSQSTITFHSEVIARRENDSGEVNVLLKWEPNDILPDVWVPEDKVSELKSKTVPMSTLPPNCLAQLVEQNIGFECKPKTKQRRK